MPCCSSCYNPREKLSLTLLISQEWLSISSYPSQKNKSRDVKHSIGRTQQNHWWSLSSIWRGCVSKAFKTSNVTGKESERHSSCCREGESVFAGMQVMSSVTNGRWLLRWASGSVASAGLLLEEKWQSLRNVYQSATPLTSHVPGERTLLCSSSEHLPQENASQGQVGISFSHTAWALVSFSFSFCIHYEVAFLHMSRETTQPCRGSEQRPVKGSFVLEGSTSSAVRLQQWEGWSYLTPRKRAVKHCSTPHTGANVHLGVRLEDWCHVSSEKGCFHRGQEHQHDRVWKEEGWWAAMSVCLGEPSLLAEPGTHIKPTPAEPSGKASAQLSHPRALLRFLYLSNLFKCVCGGERVKASTSIPERY